MTASTMLYLSVVALAGSAAAFAADAGLRRLHLPTRWAWLAALAFGPLLLATGLAPQLASWFSPAAAAAGFRIPTRIEALIVTAPESTSAVWLELADRLLAGLWAIGTLVLVLSLLHGVRGLARERRSWRSATVVGSAVRVSSHRGPAVAGFLRPTIVLPDWVLGLPAEALQMVVLHEEEHIRAGDSRLVAAALGLVALTPWNPLTWWQLRRLRAAMELDCDQRVLARRADPRAYGAALLAVAARLLPEPSLALAAFSEDSRTLQARIVAMTTKRTRWAVPAGALLLVLGAVVGVQACYVESPVAAAPTPVSAPSAAAVVSERPMFTPFSVAPTLRNRDEVGRTLRKEYPPLLRDAGVGGTTEVWVRIDERGAVMDAQVQTSSGHRALDEAALRVAQQLAFTPALNRDKGTMVWVSIPITFEP